MQHQLFSSRRTRRRIVSWCTADGSWIPLLLVMMMLSGPHVVMCNKRLTLHAAGFFPVSTKIPEGAVGRGVIPAVELALQHINDSPKILHGIHLDLVWNDTEVSTHPFIHSFIYLLSVCALFYLREFVRSSDTL